VFRESGFHTKVSADAYHSLKQNAVATYWQGKPGDFFFMPLALFCG
jgi:hypothetical protein